jgi:hypothetical protein
MRSLPWANKDGTLGESSLKRKRNHTPSIPSPQVATDLPEPTDSEETVQESADHAFDTMIPGYDNDDGYIMVEDDFLAAAKQVTRQLHQEAYQRRATTTTTGEISRPTFGAPRRRVPVEGDTDNSSDEEGVDQSALGELLRRKPPAPAVVVIPIKRREVVRKRSPSPVPKRISRTVEDIPKVTRVVEDLVTEDDEDDEDLGTPRKRVRISRISSDLSRSLSIMILIRSRNRIRCETNLRLLCRTEKYHRRKHRRG